MFSYCFRFAFYVSYCFFCFSCCFPKHQNINQPISYQKGTVSLCESSPQSRFWLIPLFKTILFCFIIAFLFLLVFGTFFFLCFHLLFLLFSRFVTFIIGIISRLLAIMTFLTLCSLHNRHNLDAFGDYVFFQRFIFFYHRPNFEAFGGYEFL